MDSNNPRIFRNMCTKYILTSSSSVSGVGVGVRIGDLGGGATVV
jgi:uncharacterized membrane protein